MTTVASAAILTRLTITEMMKTSAIAQCCSANSRRAEACSQGARRPSISGAATRISNDRTSAGITMMNAATMIDSPGMP